MKILKLVEPNIKYEKTFLDFVSSFWWSENIAWFWVYDKVVNSASDFIEKLKEQNLAINLWTKVPNSVFWLIDEENIMIWTIDIRHRLNDKLKTRWWNIWYSISPNYRKMWYWKELLRLWILKAREIWITDILITCNVWNLPSSKVIEQNWGVYENTVDWWNRYWIK